MDAAEKIDQRGEDGCCYIYGSPGEGEDWHYCAAPRSEHMDTLERRSSYCEYHRELCRGETPGFRKRKKLAPFVVDEAA